MCVPCHEMASAQVWIARRLVGGGLMRSDIARVIEYDGCADKGSYLRMRVSQAESWQR